MPSSFPILAKHLKHMARRDALEGCRRAAGNLLLERQLHKREAPHTRRILEKGAGQSFDFSRVQQKRVVNKTCFLAALMLLHLVYI